MSDANGPGAGPPPPTVSFVVPCHNYGRYLRTCLDAIFAQEGGYGIEVIAIDDCSTDDTLAILRSYDDPRLRVIAHAVNRGHVFTVNEGFAAARGRYIARVDPDDHQRPNFLARTVPILEQHPEVGLVYADVALIDGTGRVTATRADTHHGGRSYKGNELIELLMKPFISVPTVIGRREAWMGAWPIPAHLVSDDYYFDIMLARRWEFYYLDEVLASYRVHGSNHHSRVSRDGTEETSVLWMLDRVYAEPEADPALEAAKQAAKADVYAAQYLDFANKYFGHPNNRDSRRCYLQAIRHKPSLALHPRVVRHLAASLVPRALYDGAKRTLLGRTPRAG